MILPLNSYLRGTLLFLFLAAGGLTLHAQVTNAASVPTPPPASSLVSNGDFASATKDPAWPDDWNKGKGLSWEAENGTHFLRIAAKEPGKMLMAYREINIPAGVTNLQIAIRYRSPGIVAGDQNYMDARAIFHFLDANRKPVGPDPRVIDFSDNSNVWVQVGEQCAVPPGATKLVLMPSLFKVASGTLDLAEISVTSAP